MKLAPKMFTPVGDGLIVQAIKVHETASGIVLPDRSLTKTVDGKEVIRETPETPSALVVAAGKECKHVKRGMTILVAGAQPVLKVFWKGWELLYLPSEKDIIGILDEGADKDK